MSKVTVNVTDRKNKKHILEGQKGKTLMQLIDENELVNPYGICSGEPMCGTCHIYVEKEWLGKLNSKTSDYRKSYSLVKYFFRRLYVKHLNYI